MCVSVASSDFGGWSMRKRKELQLNAGDERDHPKMTVVCGAKRPRTLGRTTVGTYHMYILHHIFCLTGSEWERSARMRLLSVESRNGPWTKAAVLLGSWPGAGRGLWKCYLSLVCIDQPNEPFYSYYDSYYTMSGYGEPAWLSQEPTANTGVTQDANTGGNITAPSPA